MLYLDRKRLNQIESMYFWRFNVFFFLFFSVGVENPLIWTSYCLFLFFFNDFFIFLRNIIDVVDERMLVFDPKEDTEDFFFRGQRQQRRDLNKKANRDQKFAFDIVYGPTSTNEDVYEGK